MSEHEEQEAAAQRGLDDTRQVIEGIEAETGEPLTREEIREIVIHGDEIAADEDALNAKLAENLHAKNCRCDDCAYWQKIADSIESDEDEGGES